jgi:hypothetical protein
MISTQIQILRLDAAQEEFERSLRVLVCGGQKQRLLKSNWRPKIILIPLSLSKRNRESWSLTRVKNKTKILFQPTIERFLIPQFKCSSTLKLLVSKKIWIQSQKQHRWLSFFSFQMKMTTNLSDLKTQTSLLTIRKMAEDVGIAFTMSLESLIYEMERLAFKVVFKTYLVQRLYSRRFPIRKMK